MKRFSITWWLVILPTSLIAAGTTILIAALLSDWNVYQLAAAGALTAFLADLAVAVSMEAIAPTKVNIGPGEKQLDSEIPAEKATVLCGFDTSPYGRVRVRGETWQATRPDDDMGVIAAGMVVSVVDRDGLTLVVTARHD